MPTISLLVNCWLVFVFLDDSDASCILDSLWTIGDGSLVLSRWHTNFDLVKERVTKQHLWVIMHALPFPLWSKDILIGIANSIGRFVALEKDFHSSFDKRAARVLVELDVSHGLLPEIEIDCNSVVIVQNLDYLKMPFMLQLLP